MNTISKWVLRTAALWAISKALQLANDSLRQARNTRAAESPFNRCGVATVHTTPDSNSGSGSEARWHRREK